MWKLRDFEFDKKKKEPLDKMSNLSAISAQLYLEIDCKLLF